MNHLELFSGTHSFGKVSKKYDYRSVSLDRDIGGTCPLKSGYKSEKHYKEDIMTWDYKQYPVGHFKLITASPVCMWWSALRACWVGRKLKAHGNTIITHEILQQDIDNFGKPMVDKVIEIIEYFKPKHYIIENPRGSKMKHYIAEKYPKYNEKYNDFSYCKFSNWGYQKDTRFWTNISGLENCLCKKELQLNLLQEHYINHQLEIQKKQLINPQNCIKLIWDLGENLEQSRAVSVVVITD